MCFFSKNEKTYLISASSDCSVSLSDLKGNLIGIFGQDSHWKLDTTNHIPSIRATPNKLISSSFIQDSKIINSSLKEIVIPSIEVNSNSILNTQSFNTQSNEPSEPVEHFDLTDLNHSSMLEQSTEAFFPKINQRLNVESTFNFENDAFVKDTSLRYNPWSKTILGRCYQESKTKKKERRAPGIINTQEYEIWDKTGQAPGGLYGSLQIIELETIKHEPKKPEHQKLLKERHAPHLFEYKQSEKNLADSNYLNF